MTQLSKRTIIIIVTAALIVLVSGYLVFVNAKKKGDIVVRSSSAWLYPYNSADEILNDVNVHLVVEATVTPNSKPYTITYTEPKRALNRTLTDIRIDRILKNTRRDVQPSMVIPIIETTGFYQDAKLGKVETPLEDYRKAESGLKYLFLLSWNEQEQKYHVFAAQNGKYNLDKKDSREIEVANHNDKYAKLKNDVLIRYNSILSK